MSSFQNTISLSLKKVRYGDSCFFIVLIYLPRMICQLSIICAVQCPPLVFTDINLRLINYFRLYVSRGLQWSRRIQITLPENPLTADSSFLLRLDCWSKL